MSDELVESVRAELAPTPADATEWPVSRRDVLRGLASVGALAAAPGAASGAAGTGIADQAYFSNYGWNPTADGGELTIDGATFTFDGSEEIGLPDGGTGTELVTPSGATASEVIDDDGKLLWEKPLESILLPDLSDLDNFGGSTNDYSINDDPPVFNSEYTPYSLKIDSGAGFIGSSSGLGTYPRIGSAHKFAFYRSASGPSLEIYFGYSDTTSTSGDGYMVYLDGVGFNMDIYRIDSGSKTLIADSNPSFPDDDWVEVEILHKTDGTITATLVEPNGNTTTTSGTDATYITSGTYDASGLGIKEPSGEPGAAVDFWRFVG